MIRIAFRCIPIIAVLLPAVLNGCGSSPDVTPTTTAQAAAQPSPQQVARCLGRVPRVTVTTRDADLDSIARQAPGGALVAHFDVTSVTPVGLAGVTISSYGDPAGAAHAVGLYQSVIRALGGTPGRSVHRIGNIVIAFQGKPGTRYRRAVKQCLQ